MARALDELVLAILTTRAETLEHRRRQVLTGGMRVNNFENRLLVERLRRSRRAGAGPIKTSASPTALAVAPGLGDRLSAPGARG